MAKAQPSPAGAVSTDVVQAESPAGLKIAQDLAGSWTAACCCAAVLATDITGTAQLLGWHLLRTLLISAHRQSHLTQAHTTV